MSVVMFLLHAQMLSGLFTYHVIMNGLFTARHHFHEPHPPSVIFWPTLTHFTHTTLKGQGLH